MKQRAEWIVVDDSPANMLKTRAVFLAMPLAHLGKGLRRIGRRLNLRLGLVESGRQGDDTRVADLHVTHDRSLTANGVRRRLKEHEEVVHATIEIRYCT